MTRMVFVIAGSCILEADRRLRETLVSDTMAAGGFRADQTDQTGTSMSRQTKCFVTSCHAHIPSCNRVTSTGSLWPFQVTIATNRCCSRAVKTRAQNGIILASLSQNNGVLL